MKSLHRQRSRSEHGAAALVVVMVLFFLMMLVAAYASRSMIFEQRTSANQYRATQALEAAEAGLQWATAMLNGGPINDDCTPSADPTDTTFRERYLVGNPDNGSFTVVPNTAPITSASGDTDTTVRPGCVRTAAGWSCACPDAGQTGLEPPEGAGAFPAFTVEFRNTLRDPAVPGEWMPGTVTIVARGCAGVDRRCVQGYSTTGDAFALASIHVSLTRALRTPPSAALTVRGAVTLPSATMSFANDDARVNGITVMAGGAIAAPSARFISVSGTRAATSIVANDPALADPNYTDAQMFATYFGVDTATLKRRPNGKAVVCGNADCTATLQAAYDAGKRMIWVDGDMVLSSAGVIGAADDPVMIVVDGNIRLNGTVQVYGLVYSTAAVWNNSGGGSAIVHGAAIAEGAFTGDSATTFRYDANVLNRLNLLTGSFVRVPGSWRDF